MENHNRSNRTKKRKPKHKQRCQSATKPLKDSIHKKDPQALNFNLKKYKKSLIRLIDKIFYKELTEQLTHSTADQLKQLSIKLTTIAFISFSSSFVDSSKLMARVIVKLQKEREFDKDVVKRLKKVNKVLDAKVDGLKKRLASTHGSYERQIRSLTQKAKEESLSKERSLERIVESLRAKCEAIERSLERIGGSEQHKSALRRTLRDLNSYSALNPEASPNDSLEEPKSPSNADYKRKDDKLDPGPKSDKNEGNSLKGAKRKHGHHRAPQFTSLDNSTLSLKEMTSSHKLLKSIEARTKREKMAKKRKKKYIKINSSEESSSGVVDHGRNHRILDLSSSSNQGVKNQRKIGRGRYLTKNGYNGRLNPSKKFFEGKSLQYRGQNKHNSSISSDFDSTPKLKIKTKQHFKRLRVPPEIVIELEEDNQGPGKEQIRPQKQETKNFSKFNFSEMRKLQKQNNFKNKGEKELNNNLIKANLNFEWLKRQFKNGRIPDNITTKSVDHRSNRPGRPGFGEAGYERGFEHLRNDSEDFIPKSDIRRVMRLEDAFDDVKASSAENRYRGIKLPELSKPGYWGNQRNLNFNFFGRGSPPGSRKGKGAHKDGPAVRNLQSSISPQHLEGSEIRKNRPKISNIFEGGDEVEAGLEDLSASRHIQRTNSKSSNATYQYKNRRDKFDIFASKNPKKSRNSDSPIQFYNYSYDAELKNRGLGADRQKSKNRLLGSRKGRGKIRKPTLFNGYVFPQEDQQV